MVFKFKDSGVNMNIKVLCFFSHLDCFRTNLGDLSEDHEERFHQDIKVMEERYQGRWDVHMMVDYCWNFQLDCLTTFMKSYKRKFVNVG